MQHFNFYELFQAGSAIFSALTTVAGQITSGTPVALPPIRFTAFGKHIEIDATAKQV